MCNGFVHRMAGGLRYGCLWILLLAGIVLPGSVEGANRFRRTPEEVEALIKQVGAVQPDWWD